jgi:hypothetical protein
LNYPSADDAARKIQLASTIAALLRETAENTADRGFEVDAAIARRINELSVRLSGADDVRSRVDRLVARLDHVASLAREHRISIEDIEVATDARSSLRFLAREGWVMLFGTPVALWGRVNHWLPIRAARLLALKSPADNSDPAMHTVVAGAVFVLTAYVVQSAVVAAIWGAWAAVAYASSLPSAADIGFSLSDRFSRVSRRARALALFRRERALHEQLRNELSALRWEVLELDRELGSAVTRPG